MRLRDYLRNERFRLLAAFAAVYVVWGSTYLAIRFAIESIPPFLMMGARFLLAGGILYVWLRARGVERPSLRHWKSATAIGALMLLGGMGLVAWSQQTVPSGLAALLVATVPLWIAVLSWFSGDDRPSTGSITGLLLGFAGILLLIGPEQLAGSGRVNPIGALALTVASISWAIGSLYSRRAAQHASQSLATAMSMLAGGVLLVGAGAALGEFEGLSVLAISVKSLLSLAYLVVFGSLVAFSAYIWLMKATTPARAATYAYVNPVIALVLGWALVGEALTTRTVIAALVIVAAVSSIVSRKRVDEKRGKVLNRPVESICPTPRALARATAPSR